MAKSTGRRFGGFPIRVMTHLATGPLHSLGTALVVLGLYAAPGCSVWASTAFRLTSSAFSEGQAIPVQYTCDGQGMVPPLAWTAPPAGTRSLALIVTDPDAPDPRHPRMTWVHWIVFDLPPSSGTLKGSDGRLSGGRGGLNSWKRLGYGGPCPPIGRHHYFFRLYALDTRLSFGTAPTRKVLLAAMRGHVLATAVLMGTYQRMSH